MQGGSGGTSGTDGDWDAAGEDGADGAGGKVWSGTIEINPQQTFVAGIGTGGGLGQEGGETTFGQYSSAQGKRYSPAYTDVASGDAYGRTGVSTPLQAAETVAPKAWGEIKENATGKPLTDRMENPTVAIWLWTANRGKGL